MEGMSSVGKVVSETRLEDYKRLAQVARKQVRCLMLRSKNAIKQVL